MRRFYLDNIRWAAVLLVMAYHVFYAFNAAGVMGGVGSFSKVQYQDGFLYFVYPWFMVLLFAIAGMSAKYALEKMPAKEFLQKRTWKLLVPSTLGLFVYQWIVGYCNIKIGGGLEYIPSFLVYPVSVISGTGPLWFAQVLWLFSLLILLVRRIDKREYLRRTGEKCNVCMLLVSVVMGGVYVVYYFGENYADAAVLESLFTNVYAWFMTFAVLGCGKKWFNRQNAFSLYMTKKSYGFYVLHYTFIPFPCYYLKNNTHLLVWAVYMAALSIVFIGTPVLYALISRIPVVRYLVLGIRREHDKR